MNPVYLKLLCVALAAGLFAASGGKVDFEHALTLLSGFAAGLPVVLQGAKK